MKTYESPLFKKIFSKKNKELQEHMDTFGDTIGCVFSSDGKQYEIVPADERASEKAFKDFECKIDDYLYSALENFPVKQGNHQKKSISEKIHALFKQTGKDTL